MAAPLNLPGIYTGAALGPGASAKLGQTMAGEGWVADQVRANLLQTGVATGKIDPKSLSPTDTNLLQHAVTAGFPGGAGALKGGGGAGQLGGLGGAISTALGWGLSNSEDFVGGLLSLPAGAWELNKSIVSSIESPIAKATGIPLEPHYTLPQIAQGMKNQYIHDFTNLSPGHIVNPLLDVGGVLAGGEGIAARLGRVASVADAAEAGNVAAKALVKVGARAGARPAVPLLPPEFYEQAGLQPMTIPGG